MARKKSKRKPSALRTCAVKLGRRGGKATARKRKSSKKRK